MRGYARLRLALVALLVLVYGWALVDPISPTRADYPFSPNIRVNAPVPGWSEVDGEIVGGQPNQAFAVWTTDADAHIHFASTMDGGDTWGPNARVSDLNHTPAIYPTIAVDASGNLFVVWNEVTGLLFGTSSDGGVTWSDPSLPVGDANALPASAKPALAASGSGNVYIAWSDFRDGKTDIYFTASSNGGSTWITPNRRVDDDGTGAQKDSVDMAVDSAGDLYVSWEDYRLGGGNVFVSRSTNGGMAWSPNVHVTQEAPGKAYQQSIAAGAPGALYVAWADIRRENDIYFSKSTDSGTSWTNPNIRVNTDQTPGNRAHPAVVVDMNGRPSVAWHIQPFGPPRLEFATSSDGGSTWTSPELQVNDADAIGDPYDNPVAAVDGNGRVYVAWEDSRNGAFDLDIYLAYFDPGASPPYPSFPAVEGFYAATPGIIHVLPNAPAFNFTYLDYDGDPMTDYAVNVWDAGGTAWLWGCNRTLGAALPVGTGVTLTYGQPPCPSGPPLQDGVSYLLRIRVRDDTGLWSTEVPLPFHMNQVLGPLPPVSPADGSFVACSGAQILTWTSPGLDAEGDAPSFRWEVASDPSFITPLASGTGPSAASLPIGTCPTGTFYWRVRVGDGWETGLWGNPAFGYWMFTTFDPSQVAPPRIVRVEANASEATIEWTIPWEGNVLSYEIFGGPNSTGLDLENPLGTVPVGTYVWSDSVNPPGVDEFYYVVRALGGNQTSRTSNTGGWFSMNLTAGGQAISLPLNPLQPTSVSDLQTDLGASSISYMESGAWVSYDGTPTTDRPVAAGDGYFITMPMSVRGFVTGEPGSMISYRGPGGFESPERESAHLEVVGSDAILTFTSPAFAGDVVVYRADSRQGVLTTPTRTEVSRLAGPPAPAAFVVTDVAAVASPGERCYLVVPVAGGVEASSAYSVCVHARATSGVDALGPPLSPSSPESVDRVLGAAPSTLGMLWWSGSAWIAHFTEMPAGVYDTGFRRGVGYQLATRVVVLVTFTGT